MRSINLKTIVLVLLAGWLFQSCSDDSLNDSGVTAEEFNQRRSGGNGGGGNGGGGNGGGNNGGGNNGGSQDVDNLNNDILEDWTDLFLEIERYAGGMRPNASARAIAYVYLTAYETALPGMRGYTSNSDRLNGLDINRPSQNDKIDFEVALNTAFATAIDHFLINVPQNLEIKINEFQIKNESTLTEDLPSNVVTTSNNWGQYVAEQIIAYSLWVLDVLRRS